MPRDRTPAPARESDGEPKPKRLTLSQIVEQLLARGSTDRSYVVLTRNARGETQVEVKVNTSEHGEVQTVEDAEARAIAVYDRVSALYPPRETLEQTTTELTRNAKGETQIAVQIRSGEDGEVRSPEAVAEAVVTLYDRMRARYPMSDGNTAKPGSVAS